MPPGPDLGRRQLPLHLLTPGHRLVRVHTMGRDPLFFGSGQRATPRGRWDSPQGSFGTCYLAEAAHPYVAFAERFLRDPDRTLVPEAELLNAAVSLVRVERIIAVVPLHGASLKRLGANAGIVHGDHRESRLWAEALHDHEAAPGGVRWRSRIDDDGFVLALFDRSRSRLKVLSTVPLLEAEAPFSVEAWLDRYGAAVVEERDR